MTMAKKEQQTQLDEYQSEESRTYMEDRLELIASISKRIFCPDLQEGEDELRF